MGKKAFDTITVGFIETNCYLVPSPQDSCLYLIDPGADAELILKLVAKHGKQDVKIILTHGHIDHISAIKSVIERGSVSGLWIDRDDIPLYMNPGNAIPPWIPALNNAPAPFGDFGQVEYETIKTPGHTRGSVCFHFKRLNALFSGDTIFRHTVGRTDLPGGSQDDLIKSIKEKIFSLPGDLQIFPGHGLETTVEEERHVNPHCMDLE